MIIYLKFMDIEAIKQKAETLLNEAERLKNGRNNHQFDNEMMVVKGWLAFLSNPQWTQYQKDDLVLLERSLQTLEESIIRESKIRYEMNRSK